MRCVICNSSDIELKKVEEEIRSDGDILLFPMKVLVCLSCGERYYERKAMRKIEGMRSKLKKHNLMVEEVGKVLREHAAKYS